MKRFLTILLIGTFIWACSSTQESDAKERQPKTASQLYKTHCSICHGKDGRKGLAGAGLLPESKLSVEERVALITYGKGNMMAYEGVLSEAEIEAIAVFTTTLK